jgi:cell division septal protein FtsQ
LLLGVCVLGWQLLTSPQFRVEHIEVEGNRLLSSQHISQVAGVHGINIFYVNTRQVEQRLGQLSLVRDARVSVQLPNQVRVRVTERQPVVTWVSGGTRMGVDEEGAILPPQAIDPQTITVEALETDAPGGELQMEPKAIAVALALHELRPDLRRFLLHPERGIGIVTQEGWPVYFGWETRDLPMQLEILERARPALRQEEDGIEYVDLRFPAAPYYHRAQSNGR